jgi:hypothetical protein
MAWGYRLEVMSGREALRCRELERACSVTRCGDVPQFLSGYRYSRTGGSAVTVSRALCVKHARRFSMKYSLAWPNLLRRAKRPLAVIWNQLAA